MLGVLRNLSIRTKVITGFGAVVLVIAALGLAAVARFASLNAGVQSILNDNVDSVCLLAEMRVSMLNARISLLREIYTARDPLEQQAEDVAFLANLSAYDKVDQDYVKTIASPEEQKYYDAVLKAKAAFLASSEAVRTLVRGDRMADATALFIKETFALGPPLDAALGKDLTLNMDSARAGARTSADGYHAGVATVMGLLVLAVVLAVGIGLILIRTIAAPVRTLTGAMLHLAGKNLRVEIPERDRADEVGQMADAVQVFKDNMIQGEALAAAQEAERAAKQRRATQLEGLVHGFEAKVSELVGMLSAAATELEATARSMSTTADRSNQLATSVGASAEEAGAGAQTVAAAAEQLSASINEISRQVAQSARVTGRAVQDVRRTDDVVQDLAEGAQRIGKVLGLISTIASQTNLLALNATIEAARAGDAGKGFAVVASEVKSLANQTAKATEEIAKQITQIQGATGGAVQAIRDISGTIEEVGTIAANIAAAVEEQGAATVEIARNVQQTAVSTQEVTVNITGVSNAANETGAASHQVLGAAAELSRQAAALSNEVGRFIAGVRAA